MKALRYLLDRIREKSTWAGLGTLLAGVGIAINPALWQEISAVGVAVAGLGMALTADRPKV
jgi:hypothetical protein